MVYVYILPSFGSGVQSQRLALLIKTNWVGFLPEDGDRAQSPKRCFKQKQENG